MNTERIKSVVLLSLVIMSFVLTTRIWFNVSIEGLFVMLVKDKPSQEVIAVYDKEKLLKPDKVVVHKGTNDALLFNNQYDKDNYSSILKSSNDIIKDLLDNRENYIKTTIGIDKLQNIREGRAVELIYKPSTQLEYIKSLLDVQKNLWNDVKEVTSIIIAPGENKVYIVDKNKAVINQFTAINMSRALDSAINQMKTSEDLAVFLSDLNGAKKQLYGEYAIAQVSIATMPILTVKKEVETDTELKPEIAEFFDERGSIIRTPDIDGTVTYTDREEETIKIDKDGVLEYYKYNVAYDDIRYTADMREAVSIAANYANKHLGFEGDFYLSDIKSLTQGGRTSYVISFDYRYNGIPVITESDPSNSAIEVEVVGKEVRRYKRNVSVVASEARTVEIMTFNEILDMVQGGLDAYLSKTKAESIAQVNDLYLAYIKEDDSLIPYWVIDVDVQSNSRDLQATSNKKYFIRAEDGSIPVEQ